MKPPGMFRSIGSTAGEGGDSHLASENAATVLTQRTGVRRVRANCPRHYESRFYFAVCGRLARLGGRQRLQSTHCYLRVFDCAEDQFGMMNDRLQSRHHRLAVGSTARVP